MSLEYFYRDTETRDAVKAYFIEYLEQEALRRIFAKEDVSGIADAKNAIIESFESLASRFDPKMQRPIIQESE